MAVAVAVAVAVVAAFGAVAAVAISPGKAGPSSAFLVVLLAPQVKINY
jgi:hypothetical protein